MPLINSIKVVSLEPEEYSFILRKFRKERQSFFSVFKSMLLLGIAIPMLTLFLFHSLKNTNEWEEAVRKEHFPDYYFLIVAGALILIVLFVGVFSYWVTLRKLAKDVRGKQKIIECTTISRRVFMAQNGSFHFYLNSGRRLSIEVRKKDYASYVEGDEINIEYSRFAGEYLGYY